MKFGEKFFQTKLLSRLSHKVCRLLSSPVLLFQLTIKKANLFLDSNRGTAEMGLRGTYISVAMAHTVVLEESRLRMMRIFYFTDDNEISCKNIDN